MATREFKYTKEEHARLGTELYEQKIRPLVEAGNHGKIVAIDVDTGEYEVDADGLAAAHRLFARPPDAQIWSERIGHPAVVRFRSPRVLSRCGKPTDQPGA